MNGPPQERQAVSSIRVNTSKTDLLLATTTRWQIGFIGFGFRRIGGGPQRAFVPADQFAGEGTLDLAGAIGTTEIDERALILADFLSRERVTSFDFLCQRL